MEAKLKHLDFVQSIIGRMAGNSFLIKGWSITLVSAVFVLAVKDGNPGLVPVAYLPVVVFWFLDAYFLRQERMYRRLYDAVRATDEPAIDFDLNATVFGGQVQGFGGTMTSLTLRWFHGSLLLAVAAVNIITQFG